MKNYSFKLISGCFLLLISSAQAFCGFYVSKADADLFNESSKVIIAREDNKTILTMANDFKGDVSEFALVVPVPTVMQEGQIQVGDNAIIDRIDAYSAPRLVEYFDSDPCSRLKYKSESKELREFEESFDDEDLNNALGVTIEASFSVGEYDILILSAEESNGLETWLVENDYNIPEGAAQAFNSYIKQGMKFFVAKVNLETFEESGQVFLRPLLMAFESDDFMLPIQLGTVNANGPQDLVIFMLSPRGRVESSNYRMANIPSDINIPEFVEDDFGNFYLDMFAHGYEREDKNIIFLEYAWDMSWCDPCAADPLSEEELQRAGVFWLDDNTNFGAPNVYLTRMHLRYTSETHPEDLMFEVTDNRENFQGRYVLQRPFKGEITCEAGKDYILSVQERQEKEAQVLANLTGWDITDIRAEITSYNPEEDVPSWWERTFDPFR